MTGLAGGLAAYNTYQGAKALSQVKDVKDLGKLGAVSVSLGFSSSKSTSTAMTETVAGSTVVGRDVTLLASGAGDGAGSDITVTGSTLRGTGDVTLAADGAIRLAGALARGAEAGSSKSSGASMGLTLSANGLTGTLSANMAKGNYTGSSATWTDTLVAAGGTAHLASPGAVSLDAAQLAGSRVLIDAGSLAVKSEQDTSTYRSQSKSVGASISVPITRAGGVGVSGQFSSGKQSGDFASVGADKQAGVFAGAEGFAIRVGGHTELTGGVLASTAGEKRNSLTTGTLAASDIANRESYRVSQISLSGGATIGGGNSSQVGSDKNGQATTPPATQDKALPATQAGGTVSVSAGLPVMLKASGNQASTTHSAIAAGSITVTSEDTQGANSSALVQLVTYPRLAARGLIRADVRAICANGGGLLGQVRGS